MLPRFVEFDEDHKPWNKHLSCLVEKCGAGQGTAQHENGSVVGGGTDAGRGIGGHPSTSDWPHIYIGVTSVVVAAGGWGTKAHGTGWRPLHHPLPQSDVHATSGH